GDWEITVESPQGARTTPMTLTLEGEKLTGKFTSPAGELPLTGTLTGNDIKLSFTLLLQGTPLDITMTGKVEGETMSGKASSGGSAEGTFRATRPATTAAAAPATAPRDAPSAAPVSGGLAGTWEVTIKTGGGDVPATATITDDNGKISGTFSTQMGDL